MVVLKVLTADGAVALCKPQAKAGRGLARKFPQSLSSTTPQRDAPTIKAWIESEGTDWGSFQSELKIWE